MNLYQKIKTDVIELQKALLLIKKEGVTDASLVTQKILTLKTLLGEMELKATVEKGVKVVSNDSALSVLKSNIKAIRDNIDRGYATSADIKELENMEYYMPIEMTEENMRKEIQAFIINKGVVPMGVVMKHFKETFPNRYNGKVLSQIVKEYV